MIDLHTHSTFSDGSLTPARLVAQAAAGGVTALALTDHDCTGGIPQFLEACKQKAITGIPGVEISADVAKGTMHMLGYHVDHTSDALEAVLLRIRNGREIRNQEILGKLNDLGMALTWDEVASHAGEDVVGRPHFSQAMIDRNFVKTKAEAFNRYLAKGECAYVDRVRLSVEDSIKAVASAGGVAVLAHPFTLGLGGDALREFVADLVKKGLQGIEVYYSEHSPQQEHDYLELTRAYDLVATGGSDFHGAMNPAVRLGTGFGSLRVPVEAVEQLAARATPPVV